MELWIVVAAIVALLFGLPLVARREGESYSEAASRIGDMLQSAGGKMQAAGCALTLAVTVPIVGFIFSGWIGLAVGLAIALAFAGGALRSGGP